MNRSIRISRRNEILELAGIVLTIIGVGAMLFAVLYILSPAAVELAAEDSTINWLRKNAYEAGWIGYTMTMLGMLIKWQAEDWQEALSKTNRFVEVDGLRELQATRRAL